MIYAIIYFTIGLFFTLTLKLARFYDFNRYELALIWLGWPWIMFSILFFGLAGVGDDE